MTSDHDRLRLTPQETRRLDFAFLSIVDASGYPDGYAKAVTREALCDFQAERYAILTDLAREAAQFLARHARKDTDQ